MSSAPVYILPFDPKVPAGSQVVPNVDPVKLWSTTPSASKIPKVGSTRVFYNTPAQQDGSATTAIVSLGDNFGTKSGDERRELLRKAVGSGVKQIKDLGDGDKKVVIDASADPHAAGTCSGPSTVTFR